MKETLCVLHMGLHSSYSIHPHSPSSASVARLSLLVFVQQCDWSDAAAISVYISLKTIFESPADFGVLQLREPWESSEVPNYCSMSYSRWTKDERGEGEGVCWCVMKEKMMLFFQLSKRCNLQNMDRIRLQLQIHWGAACNQNDGQMLLLATCPTC